MKLYLKFFSIHLKSQMQYKLSFFLTIAAQFFVSFTALLGVLFIMFRFVEVAGFTYQEVLLCFAIMSMSFSLAECFGRGFDMFPQMIGNGEFDRMLVRPRPIVFQVLASRMELSRIGRMLQSVIVFCYAIPTSGIDWTGDKVFVLVLMIGCGSAVFFGLFIIYAAFSFFTLEGLEFMNLLTNGGCEFGSYPFSIYGEGVLKFLTYVVPLALFQYYPLLYLLERENSITYMLSPLMGLLFLIPAYALWQFGISRYKSTGS